MDLDWIKTHNLKLTGICLIVFCLVLVFHLTKSNPQSTLSVNVVSGKLIDLRNLQEVEMLSVLNKAQPGTTFLVDDWQIKEQEAIWLGDKSGGRFYVVIYLPEFKQPFLASTAVSSGRPGWKSLVELKANQKFYIRLTSKAKISETDENLIKEVSAELPQFAANFEQQQAIDVYSERYKLELDPRFLFEIVAFGGVSAEKITLTQEEADTLTLWLIFGILVFIVFFVFNLISYLATSTRLLKYQNRGASLVEMTVAVGLITLIALAAVTTLGQKNNCSLYNSSGYISGENPYDIDTALKCCTEEMICFGPNTGCVCGKAK